MNEITFPYSLEEFNKLWLKMAGLNLISPKSHAFAHGCSKLGKGKKRSQWRTVKRLAAVTGKPEHWFFMEEGQEDATAHYRESTVELDEKEQALLSLFNQLPEAEKLRLILHTKSVLHEIELLKNDVYDIINSSKT
jgi:hypothetical protein